MRFFQQLLASKDRAATYASLLSALLNIVRANLSKQAMSSISKCIAAIAKNNVSPTVKRFVKSIQDFANQTIYVSL